jgi:hypothetical protein
MRVRTQNEGSLALAEVAPARAWSSLTLDELRLYRRRLAEEEEKISYWRRLVHATNVRCASTS